MVRLVEHSREAGLEHLETSPHLFAADLSAAHAVPEREHAVALGRGPRAQPCGLTISLLPGGEVTTQMCPAQLPLRGWQRVVGPGSVTRDYAPEVLAQKQLPLPEDRSRASPARPGTSTSGQTVEGERGIRRHPEPVALTAKLPPRLIGTCRGAGSKRPPDLPVDGEECVTDLLEQALQHADRRRLDIEKIAQEEAQVSATRPKPHRHRGRKTAQLGPNVISPTTPAGAAARLTVPQAGQRHRWSRCSVMCAQTRGRSIT